MKKVAIKLMDRTGDTRQEFDLEDEASRIEAKKVLDDVAKKAAVVVTVPGAGQLGEVVKSIDQLAEENVVIPAIVGG